MMKSGRGYPNTGAGLSPGALLLVFAVSLVLISCNEEEELVKEHNLDRWRYMTEDNGLADNYVNTLFEDSKGNIWIGTAFGLSVYNEESGVDTYNTGHGLLSNNVFAIAEDPEGRIWVGTPAGINILVNDQWYYFNYFYGVGAFALLSLTDESAMLIGTGGYGIYQYRYGEEKFSEYQYINACDSCNSINTLFEARDASIWVSTFKGARRIRGASVTTFDKADGLPGNVITSISEDSWDNIWIGTVEGATITKVSGNLVSQVSFSNGAEQNFIFGIQEDSKGDLWVGTVGNGLFRYDGALMHKVYEGPPDNTITAMLKDSHGNLWIGTTEAGVAQYIMNPLR